VINAEQRKLTAELSLARARADYATRLAELERWAGGRLDPAAIAVDGR
jgi:outer membrane protein TolC